MIARPELKLRGRHDLRLHTAHVAANRNQVFRRLIEQMMAAETESVNLFRREGNVVRNLSLCCEIFSSTASLERETRAAEPFL